MLSSKSALAVSHLIDELFGFESIVGILTLSVCDINEGGVSDTKSTSYHFSCLFLIDHHQGGQVNRSQVDLAH